MNKRCTLFVLIVPFALLLATPVTANKAGAFVEHCLKPIVATGAPNVSSLPILDFETDRLASLGLENSLTYHGYDPADWVVVTHMQMQGFCGFVFVNQPFDVVSALFDQASELMPDYFEGFNALSLNEAASENGIVHLYRQWAANGDASEYVATSIRYIGNEQGQTTVTVLLIQEKTVFCEIRPEECD